MINSALHSPSILHSYYLPSDARHLGSVSITQQQQYVDMSPSSRTSQKCPKDQCLPNSFIARKNSKPSRQKGQKTTKTWFGGKTEPHCRSQSAQGIIQASSLVGACTKRNHTADRNIHIFRLHYAADRRKTPLPAYRRSEVYILSECSVYAI